MNSKWSLDVLYKGFDTEKYKNDLAKLEQTAKDYNALPESLDADNPVESVRRIIEAEEALNALVMDLEIYAALRQAADTKDAEATSQLGRIMAIVSTCAGTSAQLQAFIASLSLTDALIDSDELLKEYRYYLTCIKEDSRYLLSKKEEDVFAAMNLSGANAWSELQALLTSSVPVEYNGEITNLSAIRNMAYSPDAAVRRSAYEAELRCYDRIKDSVAYSLNSIKLQVLNECRMRGYESPLQKAVYTSRMRMETLDALMSAIEKRLPVFHKYLKLKAKALGHENGLPWYDLFAPMGRNDKKYTVEDARSIILDLFGGFDSQLHDMAERAFDESWIDFYPRDGKTGGAFCEGLPNQKESRILTNFDSSFGDVVTLAHELGHAFHDEIIYGHRPLNTGYSMPVAETASTFNENILVSSAIDKAETKEEKIALIESQLCDACQIICDIYSRFTFEKEVFDRRNEEFLSADELCAIMLAAQKKAYGDGLDPETLHPFMWLCKSHYYSGGTSFYNFPYAFGGLFARGLYMRYKKEGASFVAKYKKLLFATSVMSAEDTAKVADIDLTSEAFWLEGLDSYADEIAELEALLK